MLAALARLLGSVFGMKLFMSGTMMVIVSIVAYNLVVEIIEEAMNFAVAQMGSVSSEGIVSPTITGFAGWFLAQVKLPECFAVMVSCITIRFILRKIPFLKW